MFIDGLECGVYDREVFEELRAGNLAAIVNTVSFWEDAGETLDRLGMWRDLIRENADLVTMARTAADIEAAHAENKTAIVMGSQGSELLDGRLRYVELFHDLGLRVMQLTYNNQNAIGGSCYEEVDSGLARFGKEVVREMNAVGMLVDLSHVGNKTGLDAVEWSQRPVAITHANPSSVYPHPRNKPDDLLRALAERGGVLGLATYRNINGDWIESVDRWCELVKRAVDLIGVDHVGIGTDLSRKSGLTELNWMRMGRWTRTPNFGAGSAANPGKAKPVDWMADTTGFPVLADALGRNGFTADEASAIMGGNWLRLYRTVFGG
ncbi:membrane dipeptidase [Jatrophihabitans cynanchi]|jgi:membrane dipeptidase|uniref:Membrane dipeptidase n=1 Tax=Jatrophihabitans cynanchi TaxID=2944128 RepID=A0ABY7K5Z5_9ACTN|nr:membrane dipeptidase [Jatrophihabitans sp. SB3-54]WAX59293.1 membrane dipeptidase [Jatrophihabitans sp. SB3-54]